MENEERNYGDELRTMFFDERWDLVDRYEWLLRKYCDSIEEKVETWGEPMFMENGIGHVWILDKVEI